MLLREHEMHNSELNLSDSAVWNESVEDTFLVEDPNTKAIYGSEIGPGFFDSLKALPPSTVFNMDLNLANSSYEIALAEAKAAREHLGSQLTSFSGKSNSW